MPRRIRDLALAAAGVAILLGALALVDERVPHQLGVTARDVSTGSWVAPGTQAGNLLMQVTSSSAAGDVFLLAMLGAGVVLVFLMLRT